MHNCPRCYSPCYCSGDWDDIPVMKQEWVNRNCECDCETEEDLLEEEFDCCGECDLPDACSDFGCAIENGLRDPYPDNL